jgi:hypothetical protein
MTTHLDEVELVDALDGRLTPALEGHLHACTGCTTRVQTLRDAVAGVQLTADVPEPSPLYWEHFSRRVHDAVREDAIRQQRTARWWRPVRIAALTAAALVAIALATVVLQQARQSDSREAPVIATQTPPEEPPQRGALDVDGDPDWALVRAVADDLYREDAPDAGIHARPGSADRVADEMSPAERQELARLLEDELKRTGA